jgi:hypothetical protein
MAADGTRASLFITVTVRLVCPQAPRKLQSFTEMVYAPSLGNRECTTLVGGLKVKAEFRNDATSVVSASALVTVNSGVPQARPPEPEEADRSTTKELQPLSVEGRVSATLGSAGATGAAMA